MNQNMRNRQVLVLILVFLLCLCLSYPVLAAAPDRPDAGTTLGGLQERVMPPEKKALRIEVHQQQQDNPTTNGPQIKVNGIRITGQKLYSEDKLFPLVSDAVGKELTLGEIEALAGRLSKYFHEAGYLVAKAYIPAQDIKDGVVEIAVVVGQYGRIDIRNHSKLTEGAVTGLLSSLKSGDYIRNDILERALLLLNDTSGISAKATLAPGIARGTSDIIVEVSDTSKMGGQIYTDNYGNRFTGQTRAGLSMNINNLSNIGDAVNIGGIYTGSHMNDYNLSYVLPTGSQGAKLGVSYSRMHYLLGEDFASLNASGIASTTSIYETYAFTRSRSFNLNGRIGYDKKQLQDRIDAAGMVSEKKAGVWNIGLNGDSRDSFGGGGVTIFVLTHSRGHLDMRSADAQVNDAQAQTAGSYNKTNLSVIRAQSINNRLNFYLQFIGQVASKNLESSEKLFIGGAKAIRAYPQGEAPGDEGYILTGEFCWNLPTPSFQLAAFIDNGRVTLNKNPWDEFTNRRTLTGAGIGLIWNRQGNYSLRCDYAWKITSDQATSDTDKNGRFWLQGVKYF